MVPDSLCQHYLLLKDFKFKGLRKRHSSAAFWLGLGVCIGISFETFPSVHSHDHGVGGLGAGVLAVG